MGIYDTVVLHQGIVVDGFPFDSSFADDGWRLWQTKDLNPSMDHYFIRPYSDDDKRLALFRREPPVTLWTTQNEGWIEDDYPDVVEDADHWRHVRFSGELALGLIAEDHRHYDLVATFGNGFLKDIWLDHYSHEVANEIPEEYRDIDIDQRKPRKGRPAAVDRFVERGGDVTLDEDLGDDVLYLKEE